MKIRADLVGVVPVRMGFDSVVFLRAGDDVPEGVSLGDHVVEEISPAPALGAPPKAGPGSGASKWREFAAASGHPVDESMSRDDVIAALEAAGIRTE